MTSSENSLKNYKHSLFIFPSILVFLIVYHPSLPYLSGYCDIFPDQSGGCSEASLITSPSPPSNNTESSYPRKSNIKHSALHLLFFFFFVPGEFPTTLNLSCFSQWHVLPFPRTLHRRRRHPLQKVITGCVILWAREARPEPPRTTASHQDRNKLKVKVKEEENFFVLTTTEMMV